MNIQQNLKVIFGYFIVLIAAVFVLNSIDKVEIFGYLFKTSIVILFLSLVFVNRGLFQNIKEKVLRYLVVCVFTSLLTTVVGYIALVLSVNFGFMLGWQL